MTYDQMLIKVGEVKQILADCQVALNRTDEMAAEALASLDRRAA